MEALAALPMREIAERVRARWLAQDLKIRDGATPTEIAAFEARHGLRLPDEARDYFAVVNGMADGEFDDLMIEFMSLDRISYEFDWFEGEPDEQGFIFANYCLHGWCYVLLLGAERDSDCRILHTCHEVTVFAKSLREFLAMYLVDPHSIY